MGIKELQRKVTQLDRGIKEGKAPTRDQLEQYVWKTGRVLRMLINPEGSFDRKVLWGECKGGLKKVLILEKFNAGVFSTECIKKDIIETDLHIALTKLLKYLEGRASGLIAADTTVEQPKPAKDPALSATLEAIEAADDMISKWRKTDFGKDKGNGKGKKGKKGEDIDTQEKLRLMAEATEINAKWDEEDSDPDEECPDVRRFGNCSYGRQCGFCKIDSVTQLQLRA